MKDDRTPVELETTSPRVLRALVGDLDQPDAGLLAELEAEADRVAAAAPSFTPAVRERVRDLLAVAPSVHSPPAPRCKPRALPGGPDADAMRQDRAAS